MMSDGLLLLSCMYLIDFLRTDFDVVSNELQDGADWSSDKGLIITSQLKMTSHPQRWVGMGGDRWGWDKPPMMGGLYFKLLIALSAIV
jgi:hypothetical protein